MPFIIWKPVQRRSERRDNGGRIVSLSNGVKTAMTGTIMPLPEKVLAPSAPHGKSYALLFRPQRSRRAGISQFQNNFTEKFSIRRVCFHFRSNSTLDVFEPLREFIFKLIYLKVTSHYGTPIFYYKN